MDLVHWTDEMLKLYIEEQTKRQGDHEGCRMSADAIKHDAQARLAAYSAATFVLKGKIVPEL